MRERPVWSTKNPVVGLALMAALVWLFLNVAQVGVLATSERTAALHSALEQRVKLETHDGKVISGRVLSTGFCLRSLIVQHSVQVELLNDDKADSVENLTYNCWQIPKILEIVP